MAGLVTLEVACDSHVISNLVVFEYRVREMSHRMSSHKPSDWFSVSGKTFSKKHLIIRGHVNWFGLVLKGIISTGLVL